MYDVLILLVVTVIASCHLDAAGGYEQHYFVGRKQVSYKPQILAQDEFLALSKLSDMQNLRETLRNIIVPRVVGSDGHRAVREYIVNQLQSLDWNVELHKFHDIAPIKGKLHFQNIIATLNPHAKRYLVLSCHYDSKYLPDFEFVGATDSAMPCALLVNLAHVLKEQLAAFRANEVSLMLLFFDGEEAFDSWGPKDSIYGARHLAKKWETEQFIDRIDMLVLLDLIGAPDPKFYSFFGKTENWYSRLIDIEERLSSAGKLDRYISSGVARPQFPERYFQPSSLRSSSIEDDHLPFLQRGVPVLHVIPVPFPDVWHTEDDNEAVLDFVTSENIGRIMRIFVMEYLRGATARISRKNTARYNHIFRQNLSAQKSQRSEF